MNILYVSSLCSKKQYINLMENNKTILSHASQKFNRMLVEGLIENGCQINLLSKISEKKEVKKYSLCLHKTYDEIDNDLKFAYLPRVNFPIIGNLVSVYFAFINILRWMNKHKDGLVICDTVDKELSMATYLARKFYRRHIIAIVTDVPKFRALSKRRTGLRNFWDAIAFKILQYYDGYIFLTKYMNTLLNKNNKPYTVVEGFADIKMVEYPNILENKYDKKVCLMAGLLSKIFGIEVLTKAFIMAGIDNTELHLYGSGDYIEELKKISTNHPCVKYCGELPNDLIIMEELKSTLLINPRPSSPEYTRYSFPSKNIEYMASGTPLLTTKLPGMPFEYHDHVYLIEDETIEGLANKLKELLSFDPKELHYFGLKARKFVLANKNNIISTKRIYEEVLIRCKR
jgi:glycosyltransferase involved in cell wall biosynthesis